MQLNSYGYGKSFGHTCSFVDSRYNVIHKNRTHVAGCRAEIMTIIHILFNYYAFQGFKQIQLNQCIMICLRQVLLRKNVNNDGNNLGIPVRTLVHQVHWLKTTTFSAQAPNQARQLNAERSNFSFTQVDSTDISHSLTSCCY